jgi:hypothetical protein
MKEQRDVDPVLLHAGYLNGDMKVSSCTLCKIVAPAEQAAKGCYTQQSLAVAQLLAV